MADPDTISGQMKQYEEPVWEPLLKLLGDDLVGGFRWMYEIRMANGEAVHAYKHRWTRSYIHLGETGAAYVYFDREEYRKVPALELAAHALPREDWPLSLARI